MLHLLMLAVLASNSSGKTIVRTAPGALVPALAVGRNYITNSDNLATGSGWATSGTCSVVANAGPAPFGDLDKVTCVGNVNDSRYSSATVPSSSGPFTISFWVASDSGTKTESIVMYAGGATMTGCTCERDDGGSCTVGGNASAVPYAYGSFTVTPVRLSLTCTAATPQTSVNASAHDGQYGSSLGGGGMFGRAQVEIRSHPTRYIPKT